MNAISILKGFAEAHTRMMEVTEREVHRGDELPVGDGWVRVEHDPAIRYSVWERRRMIEAPR